MKIRVIVVTGMLIFSIGLTSCKKKSDIEDEMAVVPEGEFIMGTNDVDKDGLAEGIGLPKDLFEDAHPSRKVFVKAFYIDKYEVTNTKYKRYIDTTGYPAPSDWISDNYMTGEENYPVELVSLEDAEKFCEWYGKRVPAEEEWEKAARGTSGRRYPWGDTFDVKKANISISMKNVSPKMEVGKFKEGLSPYGVYDMIGNVYEWTTSWYEPYDGNTAKLSDFGKKYKVIRGMSYSYLGHYPDEIYEKVLSGSAMASFRQPFDFDSVSPDLGFRCVR